MITFGRKSMTQLLNRLEISICAHSALEGTPY